MSTYSQLIRSFKDLIYPPLCFECSHTLAPGDRLLCQVCQEQLELLDPEFRCPRCFSDEYHFKGRSCSKCTQTPPLCTGVASAFEYEGVAASLVKGIKYGGKHYLAYSAGSFLAAQWMRLDWPTPDILVPVPISLLKWVDRGFNQSKELANGFADCIGGKTIQPLRRNSRSWSQAGLKKTQRLNLGPATFSLRTPIDLSDKTVLLIDDVMTTGSTLQCCAEALIPACPKALYAITLCRAM